MSLVDVAAMFEIAASSAVVAQLALEKNSEGRARGIPSFRSGWSSAGPAEELARILARIGLVPLR